MKMKRLIGFLSLFLTAGVSFAFSAVKYDIVVAKDGSGNYKTVQEAVNAVPDNRTERTVIFVKNGIYREKVSVPSTKLNLTIIGEDVNKTVITYNDYNPKVVGNDTINTWTSFTFAVDAE